MRLKVNKKSQIQFIKKNIVLFRGKGNEKKIAEKARIVFKYAKKTYWGDILRKFLKTYEENCR